MISFYLLWTLCYFLLLSWFAKKWPKSADQPGFSGDFPPVTLLIPFRNELENLEILVPEISKINYPSLEVLLIDDQSEDGSFELLEGKLNLDSRVKVLRSPGSGKKRALTFGVAQAKNELILCTDADCRFQKDWVERMILPFADPNIQLVAGSVITDRQNIFFEKFQQIEWSSILLLTQFFFSQKNPLMCSGANLAYRKSAFFEVKGYEQNLKYWSGDDEFLLKQIAAHFGKESCVYLPFRENLVFTKPQKDFASLLNQRVRWSGKWKIHRDFTHGLAAVGSFSIQVIWVLSLLLLGLGLTGTLVFFSAWAGKILTERYALGKVLKSMNIRTSGFDFIKTSLAHPFYVVLVALKSLQGNYVWKGRSN